MRRLRVALICLSLLALPALFLSCTRGGSEAWYSTSGKIAQDNVDIDKLPIVEHVNVAPPHAPPPLDRDYPARVKIHLEVKEEVGRLADGVEYTFWTFGDTVPGPLFRIREGDYVDFTLANHPDNKVPHNIDLHAVTGPGGGAEGSFTAPGHSSTFSFRALNPGIYIYHCATAPVGMHIANGMYGLILVEPKEGMPKVDREYYIVQGDFYTEGKFGDRGHQAFDMNKAIREDAEYVVFNGAVGALAGDNALKAEPGEVVRLFVGNGGPNLSSSFHIIGEIFDKVYVEGNTQMVMENVQTTTIAPGAATMIELRMDTPGAYTFVDHAIFRAFNKGALGTIHIEGEYNPRIYTGKRVGEVYLPEGQAIIPHQADTGSEPAPPTLDTLDARMAAGEIIYRQNCAACHQVDGTGLAGAFPPLAQADYLMEDEKRAIHVVKHGMEGPITVNGVLYNSVMPALGLNDNDIASVVTYIRNSWGNEGGLTSVNTVRQVK